MAPRPMRMLRAYGKWIIFAFVIFAILQYIVSSRNIVPDINSLYSNQKFPGKIIDGHVVDFNEFGADDARLIEHVKRGLIRGPAKFGQVYNLTFWKDDHSRGQSEVIDDYLKGKASGYFVEIGASDGDKDSVSLLLEKKRNYNGLLVEPDPTKYKSLLTKNRKASTMQVCVKTNDTTTQKEYFVPEQERPIIIPCLWMETILTASGQRTFDLLSIDVKDQELNILKTVPFSNFEIRVITVEFSGNAPSYDSVVTYLDKSGYLALHQFVNHVVGKVDIVFVKK